MVPAQENAPSEPPVSYVAGHRMDSRSVLLCPPGKPLAFLGGLLCKLREPSGCVERFGRSLGVCFVTWERRVLLLDVLKGIVASYGSGMGIVLNRKALAAGIVAFALVLGACSSSTTESSTSTEATDAASDELQAEAVTAMCRTLDLLSSAGTPPGNASVAMDETDLEGATASERTLYGRVLIEAPRNECPVHIDYADEIAYWLGF